jgi:hypothetical protein
MSEFVNGVIAVQAVFLSLYLDVEREFFELSNCRIWLLLYRTTNGLCCCYMTYKATLEKYVFVFFVVPESQVA